MKIKNGQIDFYSKWLLNHLELGGKQSRMRMKFIELLSGHAEAFRKYHMQLLKEHCHLDENGNPKVIPLDGGRGQYDIVDPIAFEHDLTELCEESFSIAVDETNRDMLLSVKDSVESCPAVWSGDAAVEYELLCKLFDEVDKER